MRAQESLLRAGRPSVHVAVVDRPTLSVGVAVPDDAPYLTRARSEGIPTARRTSGGTGILHGPGDLVWAVVLPRHDPRVGRDFVRAYGRFGAGLVSELARRDRTAAWVPAPGVSEEYCPLGRRGFVLGSQGLILGAAAQHLTVHALLHHGTLSARVDRELLARLFSETEPTALDRLGGWEDLRLVGTPHGWAGAVAAALDRSLAVGPG